MSTDHAPATPDVTAAPASGLSRRRALCGILVALAAPGVLAACSTGTDTAAPGGDATDAAAGTPLSAIPVGGGTLVEGPDGPVVLTQPTAGTVQAFDAACPHQGSSVSAPEGGVIVCPAHGSEFDATSGAVLQGPADTGLTVVPTTVVDGMVQFA